MLCVQFILGSQTLIHFCQNPYSIILCSTEQRWKLFLKGGIKLSIFMLASHLPNPHSMHICLGWLWTSTQAYSKYIHIKNYSKIILHNVGNHLWTLQNNHKPFNSRSLVASFWSYFEALYFLKTNQCILYKKKKTLQISLLPPPPSLLAFLKIKCAFLYYLYSNPWRQGYHFLYYEEINSITSVFCGMWNN